METNSTLQDENKQTALKIEHGAKDQRSIFQVGTECLRRSMQRFVRNTYDDDDVIKTNLKVYRILIFDPKSKIADHLDLRHANVLPAHLDQGELPGHQGSGISIICEDI